MSILSRRREAGGFFERKYEKEVKNHLSHEDGYSKIN